MYTTNLPDGVVIPDALVDYVEDDRLTEDTKRAIRAWVHTDTSAYLKSYWHRQIDTNIKLCATYGLPECVRFFSYAREQMVITW